ncbi:MAG: MlaD family protein [Zoogloeaceae bacterium]|nr:MlaD family protein [Zoogloeaceae bacterium]
MWFRASGQEETRDVLVIARQDISGLTPQARVTYRGLAIGKVVDISLDPNEPRDILIQLRVEKKIPLSRGITARLSYQGVTGIAQILLEDGVDRTPLPQTIAGALPRVPLEDSLVSQIYDQLPELFAQTQKFISRANDLLNDKNRRHLQKTFANLETFSARADNALARVEAAFAPDQEIAAALRDLPHLTGEARKMVWHFDQVAVRLGDILGKPSDPGEALLPQAAQVVQELDRATRQLSALLRALERAPQSLIFGAPPPPPGPGEPGFSPPSGAFSAAASATK